MRSEMILEGRTGLVTGAGSGIGRALAVAFARKGANLVLTDIDETGLAETIRLATSAAMASAQVHGHRLDVTDPDAIAALPPVIGAEQGRLDLLVNNAGVALGGTFEQIAAKDFDWLFAVNFFAVVRMTRAFLPLLHASDDARIVNISSLFGLIAPPGQTAYAASKFAVRGFSESLRHELAGSRIGVTTVHPGGVATAIAANARAPEGLAGPDAERQKRAFQALLKLPPEAAADAIVAGITRRRPRIIVGQDAKIAAAIERLLPVRYWDVLKQLGGRSKSSGDKV